MSLPLLSQLPRPPLSPPPSLPPSLPPSPLLGQLLSPSPLLSPPAAAGAAPLLSPPLPDAGAAPPTGQRYCPLGRRP